MQVGAAKSGWIGVFGRIFGVMVRKRVLRQRVTFYVAQGTPADLAVLRDMIESGKLRPVIDRRFPLSEIAAAHEYMASNANTGKILLDMR